MAKGTKINRTIVPDNFTVGLAAFDALPVAFFGAATVLFGILLHSAVFCIGAAACFAAGAAKVLWKFIVVLQRKNIWWLFIQMRWLMPTGFVLMITGALCRRGEDAAELWHAAGELPVAAFLLVGALSLVLMGVFGAVLDSTRVCSNWIEQITNCVGQLFLLLGVLLLTYATDYSRADTAALAALQSTEKVAVEVTADEAAFIPAQGAAAGLIFYPGGKVEYTAYAPLLQKLAERGITCVSVRMPLQLAFFNANGADAVMAAHPEVQHWYIAGHSLGGVVASGYAVKHPDRIDGLILLAAYPTKSLDGLRVLSLYGSEDGVLNREAYEKGRGYFPADAVETEIPGGNHAGFGSYGVQNGDGEATISLEAQWETSAAAVARFVDEEG